LDEKNHVVLTSLNSLIIRVELSIELARMDHTLKQVNAYDKKMVP
jgi:hypothetical protein